MAALMTPAVEVVLFDLDDTIFAHSRAVQSGITVHRKAHGGSFAEADDATEFARWTALEEHHYHRYLGGELGFFEQRRERARGYVEPWGIDLTADAAADEWFGRYLLEYQAAWELHDDTLPMLDALTGRRFGIITNAALEFQQQKLDALAITTRFEHVVASGEFGVAKPDPAIFRHAASLFDVGVERCVYVGDRLRTDAIGAISAGMRGIWIDRGRTAGAAELAEAAQHGVTIIHSLGELPALLASRPE